MEVDIPEKGAMGDQVVVVEDLQKRRQDILVEVMVLMEQVICLESVKGVLPDARSIINCTPEVVEVVENIVPDQHQVAVVSVMSEIFREDLLMENPIRAQEEVLFYISGSNVSGGCYSGAGGSGIIILRYMKYK